MPFKNFVVPVALVALTTSTAFANPLKNAERELSELIAPEHVAKVINSDTMKAARQMCLVTAHYALKENPDAEKHYSEVASHCAKGNLHHALGLMGGDIKDATKHTTAEIANGVTREFDKWEHDAIHMWDKISN